MANTGNTQQQINYGAAANDGQGDPLRTAFIKTDDNFDNVWLAGPVGSNITIANNTVQVNNTNGNLILSPNGIGVVQTNSKLLPRLNNTYDLGSTALKYRAGYFGTGGLVVDGNVTITGNLSAGNISYTGNVFVGDLQGSVYADDSTIMVDAIDNELFAARATISGNITADYFIGNGSQLTGLPDSYGNANVVTLLAGFGSNTISTTGNITGNYFIGNGSQLTGLPAGYANANAVAYGESGWAGNIIPSGNAVYSLGNATNQWNDLYVSNATIFMNNVPISLTAGNVLTVNGNAVLQNNSNSSISTMGNITAGNLAITGNNLTWANASITQTSAADLSITGDGQVTVRSLDGTYQWTFDNAGNLTLPNNGDLKLNNGGIVQSNNDDLLITALDDDGVASSSLLMSPNDTLTRLEQWSSQDSNSWTTADWATGTYTTQGGSGAVEFTGAATIINFVNSLQGTGHIFFSVNGGPLLVWDGSGSSATDITFYTPTLPAVDPTTVTTFEYYYSYKSGFEIDYDDQEVTIYANDADIILETTGQRDISLDSSGDLNLTGNGSVNLRNLAGDGSILIQTNINNTNQTWEFDATGNLSAPGSISAVGNITGAYILGNGSQLTGISTANTANVTFRDEIVIGTGTSNLVSGLYLAPSSSSANANMYLRVRGNIIDEPTHIHFDTGNNQYYNQYIGDDNKYILLANTGNIVINSNDIVGNSAQWTFDSFGTLTLPGGSRISPLGANLDLFANGGYVNLITADESSRMGVSGAGGFITTAGGTWQFGTTGNLTAPGNISAAGNILTGSQVIASGVIESGTGFSTGGYLSVDGSADLHNTTVTGNLSATGNVTAQNFIGNISITGNVIGTQPNVTLVAGSYDWTFDNTGNLTLPGNTFAVNYADNTLVDVVTRFEGSWTVPTGNTTQSFTVDGNNSYQMWLEGNIPNGIIVWNATVTVTNTNVPVIGQQFAWNYEGGGNILMLNSIPAQIIGTAGAISNAEPAVGNTTNVFSFGINNASGNVANVRYGWIKIS
jgi:hypothetical protein